VPCKLRFSTHGLFIVEAKRRRKCETVLVMCDCHLLLKNGLAVGRVESRQSPAVFVVKCSKLKVKSKTRPRLANYVAVSLSEIITRC